MLNELSISVWSRPFGSAQKARCRETYPLLDSNADSKIRSGEHEWALAFEVKQMMKSIQHAKFLSRRTATPHSGLYLNEEESNYAAEKDWFGVIKTYSKLKLRTSFLLYLISLNGILK